MMRLKLPNGYTVVPYSGSSRAGINELCDHFRILDPEGRLLRRGDGQVLRYRSLDAARARAYAETRPS
jgi:hypothetical protein